ncbi:hypothetical protein T484DRAFT_1752073 [Baffinella frigidus]|nr:hypothetical protein T484DRAFT_1752073 [Cryptophyta sp. CCMP2293]
MAPFPPHHAAAATRKPSHPNVVNDGIHKNDYAHLHPIRLSPHSVDATTMRWGAASSHRASNTDARAPAMEMDEDSVNDTRCTTADDCAADDKTVMIKAADCDRTNMHGELPQLLDQPSEGDQSALLGSLVMYWDPWEAELLKDEFWDCDSDFDNDAAGI